MSDCSVNAMSAPKPLEGRIVWEGDMFPTPLNYARYVKGVERVAESIELDDVLFLPVVRCRDCKHFSEDRRDTSIGWVGVFVCDSEQWSTSSLMPSHKVEPDGYCAWSERNEVAE